MEPSVLWLALHEDGKVVHMIAKSHQACKNFQMGALTGDHWFTVTVGVSSTFCSKTKMYPNQYADLGGEGCMANSAQLQATVLPFSCRKFLVINPCKGQHIDVIRAV
jgi:hypothetical protein